MQDADFVRSDCHEPCPSGEPAAALATALALWQAAEARGDRAAAAQLSQEVAWHCFTLSDIETGLTHALASRRFFAEAGSKAQEIISVAIYAWLLLETGLTTEASDIAVKAVADAEDCDSVLAKSWILNVLAVIFWYCKQLERAEALSLRAVALVRTLDDRRLLGWWVINLAGIRSEFAYRFGAAKDDAGMHRAMQEALEMNQEAIGLAESVGDAWGLHLALCNAAEYNIAIGRYEDAEAQLERWEDVGVSTGVRSRAFYLNLKSQLLGRREQWSESLDLCETGLALALGSRNIESEAQSLRLMSEAYEGLGRFDLALDRFKRFYALQSKVAAENVQRRARLAEIHYETERLKRVADQATSRAEALAVANQLDPLTGLGNRRLLDAGFERLRNDPQPYCIAVLDLDHFKSINDRYSHAVGDEVLRRVSDLMRSCIRAQDLPIRVGGEEFVLILFGAEKSATISLCSWILDAITLIEWSDVDLTLRVTASIGVASHLDAAEPAKVMAIADERLYLAKQGGRNRVVSSSERLLPDIVDEAALEACVPGEKSFVFGAHA